MGSEMCIRDRIDPHTAVAFEAANRLDKFQGPNDSQVILSTAHPAKFADAVVSSISADSDEAQAQDFFNKNVLPAEMRGLLEKERRVIDVRGEDAQTSDTDRFARLVERTREIIEERGFHGSS